MAPASGAVTRENSMGNVSGRTIGASVRSESKGYSRHSSSMRVEQDPDVESGSWSFMELMQVLPKSSELGPEVRKSGLISKFGSKRSHHSTLSQSPLDMLAAGLDIACLPFYDLAIRNLDYKVTVKTKEQGTQQRTLLNNVSAEAYHGQILAVVGPSGSGKTTFLDAIAGRISRRSLQGDILVNGEPTNQFFNRISGYVMQDDALFPHLTVRETLMYSARLRIPGHLSLTEKRNRVDNMILTLGLKQCADTRVGNEMIRGVSGGERRRVSIGSDLIHDPAVLFLDEPTSGLDSTSALNVMQKLSRMAQSGRRTVILTIHQPSYRILDTIDRVLVLGQGNVIFHGAHYQLKDHFNSLGRTMPEFMTVVGPVGGSSLEPRKSAHANVCTDYKGVMDVGTVFKFITTNGPCAYFGALVAELCVTKEHMMDRQIMMSARVRDLTGPQTCEALARMSFQILDTSLCDAYLNVQWRGWPELNEKDVQPEVLKKEVGSLLMLTVVFIVGLAENLARQGRAQRFQNSKVNVIEYALDTIEDYQRASEGLQPLINLELTHKNGQSDMEVLIDIDQQSGVSEVHPQYATSVWSECCVLTDRNFKNMCRTPELFVSRMGMMVVVGLTLGTLFLHAKLSQKGIQQRTAFISFSLALIMFTSTESLGPFLEERQIFIRETSRGAYRASTYVLSGAVIVLPFQFFLALLYSSVAYWLVGMVAEATAFIFFALIIFLALCCANSFVIFFSGLVPNFTVGLSLVCGSIAYFFLFSGFFIDRKHIPPYWLWMHYISLFKYPFESLLQNEFGRLNDVIWYADVTSKDVLEALVPGKVHQGLNIMAMVILFVGYRILFWVNLKYFMSGARK